MYFNQQMMLTSRCFTKIAKRCRLNKLTRHRFIAKEISRWKNTNAYQQSKHLDNDDEDSAGYQSYFRRKLKVIQIRSFAHKENICSIAQLPGIKETS
ncbi:hypothetical protein F511_45587 [Dorcoceras hygrometricum]|uniref:Uncharacterized protein n=1 Tax=Dorcoceras hygrometricum TaxID=472368 RepID=A0A2Z7A339_9LAMI|nr:hypothetical protein F511_45587 [Dorcoceras hygrometricum]